MAKITTQGIYSVALDGMGIILRGTPENPSYLQSNASVFQNRFAQGDRSEADFSFWWYWSESVWDKGFQEEFYTQGETGHFKSGNNVDVMKEPGNIQCLTNPTLVKAIGGMGTGAVISDSIQWGSKLLIAINKTSGTAGLYSLTTDGTLTNQNFPGESGYTINQMAVFGNYVYFTCGSSSVAFKHIPRMNNAGAFDYIVAGSYTSRGCCSTGERIYVTHYTDGVSGDIIIYTADNASPLWSKAVSFTGQNRKVSEGNMVSYNSSLYYLIAEGNRIELWNYSSNIANKIYTWDYLSNPKLSTYLSYLMIVGVVGGRTVHFLFDGYRMKTSFEQLPSTTNVSYGKYKEVFGVGYCGGLSCKLNEYGDLVYYPSYNFLTNGTQSQPITSFNGYLYLSNVINSAGSLVIEKVDPIAGATYATAGTHNISSPIHTGSIPDVDKIYHDCILRMNTLGTNEKVTVDYSIDAHTSDASATWVTLGSADYAVDGAVNSKRIPFPLTSPVISKQMKHRISLTPSATTTPKVQDVVFRYLPMTYYPYEWQIVVNASDKIELLNGQLDTKTGRQIRSNIQTSLWGNQIVDYQDVDYFTTRLTSAMTLTGTIASVLDTTNAPETGRIVVDNEEMLYTGKRPTAFDPVIRAQRGTNLSTHASASVIDNAYKVLITDISNKIPMLNNDKKLEYYTTIKLRENL